MIINDLRSTEYRARNNVPLTDVGVQCTDYNTRLLRILVCGVEDLNPAVFGTASSKL